MQKPYNFSTKVLKAYLSAQLASFPGQASAQPSSSSALMISKAHIIAQKPHGRQLNTKVCGSKSAMCKYTSPIAFTLQLHSSVKKMQGWGFVYLPSLLYQTPPCLHTSCHAIPTFLMFFTFLCVPNCQCIDSHTAFYCTLLSTSSKSVRQYNSIKIHTLFFMSRRKCAAKAFSLRAPLRSSSPRVSRVWGSKQYGRPVS